MLFAYSVTANETFLIDNSNFVSVMPFPLNESWHFNSFILIVMLIIFWKGFKLRFLMIRYLMSPECKGAINVLIWADQLNGIFLALGILLKLVTLISPVPLATLLGDGFCDLAGLAICLYAAGAGSWSCAIALYRVVTLKCSAFINEKTLIKVLFLASLAINFGFGPYLALNGEISLHGKLCFHYSDTYNEILEVYRVSKFDNVIQLACTFNLNAQFGIFQKIR